MRFGKAVPGTYILADIAAEHPALHFVPELFGDHFFFQLDGEVRNALAAVDKSCIYNSIGGTGIDTAPAAAAEIFGKSVVVIQFEVGN